MKISKLNQKFILGLVLIGMFSLILAGCSSDGGSGDSSDSISSTELKGTVTLPVNTINTAFYNSENNFLVRLFTNKVTAQSDGDPLANANVVIKDYKTGSDITTTTTDSDGKYRVTVEEGKDVIVVATKEIQNKKFRLSGLVPDLGKQTKVTGDVNVSTSLCAETILSKKNQYENLKPNQIARETDAARQAINEHLANNENVDFSTGGNIFGDNLGDGIKNEEITKNLGMTKVKSFITNLREHGVYLNEVGDSQANKIKDNMEKDVGPNMEAIGARFMVMGNVFQAWNEILGNEDKYFVPGQYEYNVDDGDIDLVSTQENFESNSPWTWEINFVNYANSSEESIYKVVISTTNWEDIYKKINETEYEVDLTEAEFHYKQTFTDYPDSTWSYDFSLNSTSDETFNYTDTQNTQEESDDIYYTIIVPRIGSMEAQGFLSDNLNIADFLDLEEEGVSYPDIGEVTFDSSLDFDLDNEKSITVNGNFEADEFNFSGETIYRFDSFPDFVEIIREYKGLDKGDYPLIESFDFSGTFVTDVFKIQGQTSIDLIQKTIINEKGEEMEVSLPAEGELIGVYEDISVDKGLFYEGEINFNLDYSNFNIDLTEEKIESKDNYLDGKIGLDGDLENIPHDNVNSVYLALTLMREDYYSNRLNIRYNIDEENVILATSVIENKDDSSSIEFTATNGADLRFYAYDDGTSGRIGYVKERDLNIEDRPPFSELKDYEDIAEENLYGDVMKDDSIYIQLKNGEIISFNPQN